MSTPLDPKCDGDGVRLDAPTRAEAARLADEIAEVALGGWPFPGPSSNAAPAAATRLPLWRDPPVLTAPIGPGRERSQHDPHPVSQRRAVCRLPGLFDTAKRLISLVSTLEALGLEVAAADPRWGR